MPTIRPKRLTRRASAGLAVCFLALMEGCVSPGPTRSAQSDLQGSRQMVLTGEYARAVPRLQHILIKYPRTEAASSATYLLGVAYYHIGGYRDALDMFRDYLREAPQGQYEPECRDYIQKASDEYRRRHPDPRIAAQRIEALRRKLEEHPGQLALQMELADLLWKRGDYEDAGRLYEAVLRDHPERRGDTTLRERVEILPEGELVLLTPSELERRHIEEQPLMFYNVSAFRSQDRDLRKARQFYIVTGQVRNLRDSVLYGVQVIVTVYGFGNMVYDTRTITMGQLQPYETRPFSVRFINFDNIENIQKHECVGTFQR